MFEYELHQLRTAELAREAARHGLVREALKGLKALRVRPVYGRDEALARATEARTQAPRQEPRKADGPTDRYTRAA
ncbi:hypothetical protein [Streptomyces sp. NPDC059063]|uniref:hypothetical protein n=1 Tax=unclassified Streptomyces TaxID=2593676 RepID=UPI0036B207B0